MLSGVIASMYARTGVPASQSNAIPSIFSLGIVGPVENTTVAPVFIRLLCRSASPGSIVIMYAVFGRKPCRGLMSMRLRCQLRRAAPSDGETRKKLSSSCGPAPRSLIVSSK